MSEPHKKSLQVLVTCEQCGLLFRTLDKHVGAQAPCPSCGQMLRITAGTRIRAPAPATATVQVVGASAATSIIPPPPFGVDPLAVQAGPAITASSARVPAIIANDNSSTALPAGLIPPPLPTIPQPPADAPTSPFAEPSVPSSPASPSNFTEPPIIAALVSPTAGNDRSTWGYLLTGLAAFVLFAGGMLVLIAAIVAVVPSPNEDWAQQKWSGVVCSLLAATAFLLPGVWLWRRAVGMRRGEGERG